MDNRPHWTDILMAVFTGLILLTYLTSDYFLWRQMDLTGQMLKSNEESFAKTLCQMQAQTVAQKNAATASRIQADAAKSSVENAKQSLQATIAASKLDERPWVGVILGGTQGGVQTKDMFSFQGVTISIRNTGKTPAIKMSGRTSMLSHLWTDQTGDYDSEMKAWNEQREAAWDQFKRQHPMGPLPPGWEEEQKAREVSMEKELFPEGGVIPPGAVNEWHIPGGSFGRRAESMMPKALYIFGKITYYDTLGGPQHTTKFCLEHLQGDSFTTCPAGNSMD